MPKNIALIENNILSTLSMRKKLTLALKEKGYNVTVVSTGIENELNEARALGLNVIDVSSSVSNPLHILKYIRNLYRALKQCKAEVCLTFTIRPAIWGNIVTRILRIPTITNITGIGPLFERNDIAYRSARILYKFVLSKTARIFFQNNDDMEIFLEKKFAKADRVKRIPGSGIDYMEYMPMPKTDLDNRFHFIFISRLIKDKGIVEYIDAVTRLKAEHPDVRCSVLGPLWLQNLKDNIITQKDLDGWISEGIIEYQGNTTDVRPFMANADCIVLPSYREGTSNVLLEACSMEKPCITCNVTGCKEIIEDGYNGLLCQPRSAESLYHAMKKMLLLSRGKLDEMGKNGRQKMIQEFDKQIVLNAYFDAIEEVSAKN